MRKCISLNVYAGADGVDGSSPLKVGGVASMRLHPSPKFREEPIFLGFLAFTSVGAFCKRFRPTRYENDFGTAFYPLCGRSMLGFRADHHSRAGFLASAAAFPSAADHRHHYHRG